MGRLDLRRTGSGAKAQATNVAGAATGVVASIATGLTAPITVTRDSGSTAITFAASGNRITASIASALAGGASLSAIAKAVQSDGAGVLIPVTLTGAATSSVTLSGTLPDIIIGQHYNAQITVNPPGSAITLDAGTLAFLAAHSIAHNGTGLLTSASVT